MKAIISSIVPRWYVAVPALPGRRWSLESTWCNCAWALAAVWTRDISQQTAALQPSPSIETATITHICYFPILSLYDKLVLVLVSYLYLVNIRLTRNRHRFKGLCRDTPYLTIKRPKHKHKRNIILYRFLINDKVYGARDIHFNLSC